MAELSVLHQEPRHKVDTFVDEMLVRARGVVAEAGPALERLLRDMIAQFNTFQARHYLITLKDVRFEWIRWIRETGQLVVEFTVDPNLGKFDEVSELRHEVVDAFVDGVVGRTVPDALRGEFSQFLRGMVTQFAAIKKHSPIDLTRIDFRQIEWLTDRRLSVRMTHHGRPFTPQEARWA